MNNLKQFAEHLKRYIKRQNFNGTLFNLKKNILEMIDELEKKYLVATSNQNHSQESPRGEKLVEVLTPFGVIKNE